ncbi:MAG: AraC family transcriptional regulator [Saccharospirillaceae bacterium]|nr:AraC family transcriptional regulator [Saccharospirillaceae bacterium]MCD8531325.1 AraC family transcriptional regulator [Saccharospirillaceae bacterium]
MIKLNTLRFPISYVQIFEEVCRLQGMNAEPFLLANFAITPEQLRSADTTISGTEFLGLLRLLEQFVRQNPKHQHTLIGLFPPTIHGHVALAAITASTVQQALDIAVRFAHQVMPAYDIRYDIEQSQCRVSFTRLTDFGSSNAFMTEMIFCALHSFLRLFGHDDVPLHLSFTHRQLAMSELPTLFPHVSISPGGEHNAILFPGHLLNNLIATRNMVTHQALESALEVQEAQRTRQHCISAQVSHEILSLIRQKKPIAAAAIAEALSLSPRTLSRRLSDEGSSLRTLYNECRCLIAQDLIRHSRMTISQISMQLGFSDEANFSRFFKQQTGKSPTGYRAAGQNERL